MKYTIDLPNDIDSFIVEYNDTKRLIHIKKEERIPVKAYKVKKICPECGGEMESIGTASLTSPIAYRHRCRECGYEDSYKHVYPRIEYIEEE